MMAVTASVLAGSVGQAPAGQLLSGAQGDAVRGRSSLVLGQPGSRALRLDVAADTDLAVQRVTRIWGPGWSRQVVVVVPDTQRQASVLVGGGVELDQLAAVATGDRIIVNPRTFATLNPPGRTLVLTHEVMHLASRAATGAYVPMWLVEGLADYAGYRELGVALSLSAREVRADLRRGLRPTGLPTDDDFAGDNPRLAATYEQAWLAVVQLAEHYGPAKLLAVYRAMGAAPSSSAAAAAFADVLGVPVAAFEREWVARLPTDAA